MTLSAFVPLLICLIPLTLCGACYFGYVNLHYYLDKQFELNPEIPEEYGEFNNFRMVFAFIYQTGFQFCGKYRQATINDVPTYVAYRVFRFATIPIYVHDCCRVVKTDDGYLILGNEKMKGLEILCMLLYYIMWVSGLFGIFITFSQFVASM